MNIIREKILTEEEKNYSYPIRVDNQDDIDSLSESKTTGMVFFGEREIDYPKLWNNQKFKLPFNEFLLKEYDNSYFRMIGLENFNYYCEGSRVEVIESGQSKIDLQFDRVFSALNYGGYIWQHFVQDALPIITFAREFLEQNPDVVILLYEGVNKKFISDFFLNKLNLKNPVYYVPNYTPFRYTEILARANKLYLLDCNNHMPCYWWNNFFYQEANEFILRDQKFENKNLIYLNRNKTSTCRFFINEDETVKFLKKYADENNLNFVDYVDTNYTIEETFDIFKNAHTVVGCHGGANYNIIFCPKGTKFIEYVFTDCMYTLYNIASSIELDYFIVPNRGTNMSEGALVDINKLQRLLEK